MPAPRLILRFLIALVAIRPGMSQERPPQEFPHEMLPAMAEDFLRSFLGPESPAEREALERIPVTPGEERQYGNRLANAFVEELRSQGIDVRSEGRDANYLRSLVAVIRPQLRNARRYRSLRIFVPQSDATEAVCFPGGTVIVSRGLLDFCDSEAALVGVLGHELSHLDHGHQLQLVRRVKQLQQLTARGGPVPIEQFFSQGMTLIKGFARPFRPEDEAEADADGATWAYRCGYDPRELARLLERMAARQDAPQGIFRLWASHPPSGERALAVRELYSRLQAAQPQDDLYIGRKNLQQRIPRAERELPSD